MAEGAQRAAGVSDRAVSTKPFIASQSYTKARNFAYEKGLRDFEFDYICDSFLLKGLRGCGRVIYMPFPDDLGMGSIMLEARLQQLEVRTS